MKFTMRFMHGMMFFYINYRLIHNREAAPVESMDVLVLEGGQVFDRVVASKLE